MLSDPVTVIAVVCAGVGLVSTIAYYIFKAREIRLLRDIRDRLPK
jgi:hypothetical protein